MHSTRSIDNWSGLLGLLILGPIAGFLILTWPVGVVFLVAAASWLLCRSARNNAWTDALGALLLPFVIGVGSFSVLYFVVNIPNANFEPSDIRTIELYQVNLRLWLHDRLGSISVVDMLVILAVLIVISRAFPKSKAVTRFLHVQTAGQFALALLTASTTFTLFSDGAAGAVIDRVHAQRIAQYQAVLRQEWDAVGKHVTFKILQASVHRLDKAKIPQLQALMRGIGACGSSTVEMSSPLDLSAKNTSSMATRKCDRLNVARIVAARISESALSAPVSKRLLENLLANVEAPPVNRRAESLPLQHSPATFQEWNAELAVVAKEKSQADAASHHVSETAMGIGEMANQALGLVSPESANLIGAYTAQITDAVTSAVSDRIVAMLENHWRPPSEAALPRADRLAKNFAKTISLLVPIQTRAGHHLDAGQLVSGVVLSSIVNEAVVTDAVQRTRQALDRKASSFDPWSGQPRSMRDREALRRTLPRTTSWPPPINVRSFKPRPLIFR